jgi:HTH-type transcriptional regulator, sugar sensing transcriptional regulator
MVVTKVGHFQAGNKEILAGLRQLGFTDYEARIYIQLLKASPATAYEVAKAAGVPRANTYAALEALAQRGAVLPVNEEPLRYVAASPKTMLEGISRQTRALCSDLSDRLLAVAPANSDDHVWMTHGEMAVQEKIEAMIAESQHSIWIKAADDVIRRHKAALQKAAARGVALMIVLFGKDADEFRFNKDCRVFIHESDGTRMGTADNLFTIAVDQKRMLTANMEGEVMAAHTGCPPIVTMALSLIRHDLYMAEIFGRFGAQIEKAFGPYLRDIRMSCFTPDQIASFKARTGLK